MIKVRRMVGYAKCFACGLHLPFGWAIGVSFPMSGVREWSNVDRWLYVTSHEKYDNFDCLVSYSWQVRVLWFYIGRIKQF